MTIHQAKGLEFDHVFVPGVATGLMPSTAHPAEPGRARLLARLRAARRRGRPAHVRRRAVALQEGPAASGGHRGAPHDVRRPHAGPAHAHGDRGTWYGENVNAKGPSAFFEELRTGRARPARPTVSLAPATDRDEQNPMLGHRLGLVRDWPGPRSCPRKPTRCSPADGGARPPRRSRPAASRLAGGGAGGTAPRSVRPRSPPSSASSPHTCSSARRPKEATGVERLPPTIGASAVIDVHPLPQALLLDERPAAAALQRPGGPHRHRDPRLDRAAGARTRAAARGRRQARPHPRGARRRPGPHRAPARGVPGEPLRRCDAPVRRARVPAPAGRRSVGGRIDAIYGVWTAPGRSWIGRPGTAVIPGSVGRLQLDIYGLACAEIWGKAAGDITLTYFYLAGGEEVTRPMDDPRPGA